MKKLFLLGLTMLLSVGFLAACGNEQPEETPPPPETEYENGGDESAEVETPTEGLVIDFSGFGGETITMWLDEEQAYTHELIDRLRELLPNTTIELESMGLVDGIDQLLLDGPAGLGGDIMLAPHDQIIRGVQDNLLLPMTPEIVADMEARISPFAVGTVQHGDMTFGIPVTTETVALFYNETKLAEAGLTPATTFEELIAQAEYFDDHVIRWNPADAYQSIFFLNAFGFELFGPDHTNGDLINFDTPAVVEGLEFFRQVQEVVPVPAGDLEWSFTHEEFVAGNLPYFISGPWSISGAIEGAEANGFEFGVSLLPTINGTRPVSFSGNNIVVGNSFTEYPELVRMIMAWMASDEGMELLYTYRNSIPALIDASAVAGLSDDAFSLGIMAQGNYAMPMPPIPELDYFWEPASAMFEMVWNGVQTPSEAAEHAETRFHQLRAGLE